jgi:hypothetical protein
MAAVKRRVSCRELFKKFNILPNASDCLVSLMSFVMNDMAKFQTESGIHNMRGDTKVMPPVFSRKM